jgi:hypothetical protein
MAVARVFTSGKGPWCAMRLWRGGRRGKPRRKLRPRRALVAALLIANQFLVASGLPLPAVAAGPKKDLSKPFPCMNRPCGCMNADQCWHSCCCFTMREKLAWAKAHGVEPPAYVCEAAAEEEREEAAHAAHHLLSACKKRCCCCCCKAHEETVAQNPRQSLPAPAGKQIVLLMALDCQGHGLLSILAIALPAIVRPVRQYEFQPIAKVCMIEAAFDSIHFSPAIPPPRIAAAVVL